MAYQRSWASHNLSLIVVLWPVAWANELVFSGVPWNHTTKVCAHSINTVSSKSSIIFHNKVGRITLQIEKEHWALEIVIASLCFKIVKALVPLALGWESCPLGDEIWAMLLRQYHYLKHPLQWDQHLHHQSCKHKTTFRKVISPIKQKPMYKTSISHNNPTMRKVGTEITRPQSGMSVTRLSSHMKKLLVQVPNNYTSF